MRISINRERERAQRDPKKNIGKLLQNVPGFQLFYLPCAVYIVYIYIYTYTYHTHIICIS